MINLLIMVLVTVVKPDTVEGFRAFSSWDIRIREYRIT